MIGSSSIIVFSCKLFIKWRRTIIYLFIYLFLVKPLDSSLESENDRYEHGGQQESDENDDNDHKDSQKRFENFRKSSFTDFSGLESKLCEFENSRNNSNDVEVENDTEKAFEIITETAGTTKEQQVIENFDDTCAIPFSATFFIVSGSDNLT